MDGEPFVVSPKARTQRHWTSSQALARSILAALTLSYDALILHRKTINTPGIQVIAHDMLSALEKMESGERSYERKMFHLLGLYYTPRHIIFFDSV